MSVSQAFADLHALSSKHREVVAAGSPCGCFFCGNRFLGNEVINWVDRGQTALCPHCGIDAVLPERSMNRPLSQEILDQMRAVYFSPPGTGVREVSSSPSPHHGDTPRVLKKLEAYPLRTDAALRRDVLVKLPWISFGLCVFFTVAAWPHGAIAWPLLALLAGKQYWRAGRALFALQTKRYGHPALAAALEEPAGTDYSPVPPTHLLYREAQDWARALPELAMAWSEWNHKKPFGADLRATDLRYFISTAREHTGGNPYAENDPL